MQELNRRGFLRLVGAAASTAAVGGLLAACSSPAPSQPASGAAPASGGASGAAPTTAPAAGAASGGGGEVVYWGHNYPSRVKIVNEIMVPGFQKQAGIKVTHNDFETNQMETKILATWAGGGEGGPDLVSVGDNNLPNYVYRKMVAPVDPSAFGFNSQDELVNAYDPGALDGFIVDGKLYGIPMDLASISMFYRKDFFKEAGLDPEVPPKTWEEVTEMGKKLVKKDANGKVTRAAWGWEARSLSSHFYYWGTLLPQKGADFLSKDGKKNGLDNAGGHAAFQYLYDTFNTDKISALGLAPTISPIDDFGSGLVAMINSGFWLPPGLEDKYKSVTYKDGVYGIARLPQFKDGTTATRLNPWVWMVSSKSKVQKQAWQFISFMTKSPENQAIWAEQAQYMQPWKGWQNNPVFTKVPYAKIFQEDLKIGVPTPRTPKFAELSSAVAKAYDRISANGDKPEPVVAELAKSIDQLLEA